MVTILERRNAYGSQSGKPWYKIHALSTDNEFPADMGNGSKVVEIDTGVEYRFDEENSILIAQNSGTGKTTIAGADITLGTSPKYDGTAQTQSVTSVVLGDATLVAETDYTVYDNHATEIGNYTLHIAGIGNYTGIIAKDWELVKGTGSVSASPDSLELTDTAGTSTLTVVGDGAVSARSGDAAVASASVSGTTVTVTPNGVGETTITVTLAGTEHYTGDSTTIAVTVTAPEETEG